MTKDSRETPERRSALVLEIELPTFYAEDLRADEPSWQDWLKDCEVAPDDHKAVGEEILHNIGDVHYGLLTVEIAGEKDSTVERVPVLMVGARVEDRPPEPEERWKDVLDDWTENVVDGHATDERMMARCDAALVKAYEPFVRWVARLAEAHDHDVQDEAFKRVVAKAVETMAAAEKAETEAERGA